MAIDTELDAPVPSQDFLSALWGDDPPAGRLVLWAKSGQRNQSYWCNLADATEKVESLRDHHDLYFGLAAQDPDIALKIAQGKNTKAKLETIRGSAESAVAIPALWIDLDIQAEVHASQELPPDKASALRLLDAVALQPSIVVDSGYGLHVYWLFHEPWFFVSDDERKQAQNLVKRLQQTIRLEAQKKGWKVDNTADLARVLRVPGSFNRKKGQSKPVTCLHFEPDLRYSPDDFEGKLAHITDDKTAKCRPNAKMNLNEWPIADIEKIQKQCAWMRHCREEQASLSEPEWYAALSILGRCGDGVRDGHALAHEWSKGHRDYDPNETDRKINHALTAAGPRTCASIGQELGAEERFCRHCKHRNEIKSPITLGRDENFSQSNPYKATDRGLVHLKSTKNGVNSEPLTNFTARVSKEIIYDDGAETTKIFEIEVTINGKICRVDVEAANFISMDWVVEKVGPQAVIYAGHSKRDHARTAIQLLSDQITLTTVYAHLGWRKIDGQYFYLHVGGALGPKGPVSDIRVEPPDGLNLFTLPEPPTGQDLICAVRSSLGMLELLPDAITLPLYCGIWRSVFGPCDFTMQLCGQTGEGKSEFAALIQQHFGVGMNARCLPGSWSSTDNALEATAFSAKDAVFVIDDFAPGSSVVDAQNQQRKAERLLRAQGNHSGKQRMRADTTLRPSKPPRCLIVSTGEDSPKGQSIQARMLNLEIPLGAMKWDSLSNCQEQAASGTYAQALSGYITWLAPRFAEFKKSYVEKLKPLREWASKHCGQHHRTPYIVAELAYGLELFLDFAQTVKAFDATAAEQFRQRSRTALIEVASFQGEHVSMEDPVERFLDALRSGLAGGHCHLSDCNGDFPMDLACGWRQVESRAENVFWEPQGKQIGWIDNGDIFLDPNIAYRIAQQVVSDGPLLSQNTLWKRMKDRGLLMSIDSQRSRNIIRKSLQGSRRNVLHISRDTLIPREENQLASRSHETEMQDHKLAVQSGYSPQEQFKSGSTCVDSIFNIIKEDHMNFGYEDIVL